MGDVTVTSDPPDGGGYPGGGGLGDDSSPFDDSYPTGNDPAPSNPSTGGGGGSTSSSSEFSNNQRSDSPEGPYICVSSFNFVSQGVGSLTNISNTWGIVAGYKDDDGLHEITFGVTT